jgi:hypothetical protein
MDWFPPTLYEVFILKIKDKLKLLSILAYVVECNGSQEVLDAIDNDIDYLHTRKKWAGDLL